MSGNHSVLVLLVLAVLAAVSTSAHAAFDFSDIQYWVGTGDHQAALVIDWNDGLAPESLAWGYRWSDSSPNPNPTAADMFIAVAKDDPRLYAKIDSLGLAIFGIGYNLNGGSFSVTPTPLTSAPAGPSVPTAFDSEGISDSSANSDHADGAASVDAGDHYQEGWFSGFFWALWDPTSDSSPFNGGGWESSFVGISSLALSDNPWIGLSFGTFDPETFDFVGDLPGEPIAATEAPEPTSLAGLLVLGTGLLTVRRRRA